MPPPLQKDFREAPILENSRSFKRTRCAQKPWRYPVPLRRHSISLFFFLFLHAPVPQHTGLSGPPDESYSRLRRPCQPSRWSLSKERAEERWSVCVPFASAVRHRPAARTETPAWPVVPGEPRHAQCQLSSHSPGSSHGMPQPLMDPRSGAPPLRPLPVRPRHGRGARKIRP